MAESSNTDPKCVIGTNSWGNRAYERAVRGSYVSDEVISDTARVAVASGLDVFDTAEDYGFGYAQRLLGRLRAQGGSFKVSAKYTPMGRYKVGQVHEAFERDCRDLGSSFIDYYWLHLPSDVDWNLAEVVDLCYQGRIGHVGVSNFNLAEARHAKAFLEARGIPLYGVQNHFSLLDREEEASGMLEWCQANGIAFWGWAVLEEGVLTGNLKGRPIGIMLGPRARRLKPLFQVMGEVGEAHGLTVTQVAEAYCASKGVVPICGCRKPYQVEQLAQAVATSLDAQELARLERAADETGVKMLRSDMFRFAVRTEAQRRRARALAIGAGAAAVAGGAALVAYGVRKRDGRK